MGFINQKGNDTVPPVKKVKRKYIANLDMLQNVMEQDARAEIPPITGDFPVVHIRWQDITSHFVSSVDPSDEEGMRELSGFGNSRQMLEFAQFGILVRETDEAVTIMHSLSLQPNRSEFFVIPRGVIKQTDRIGTITIGEDGSVKMKKK